MPALQCGMPISAPATPPQPASNAAFTVSLEPLLLVASLFWALAANRLFFAAALKERALTQPDTWVFALALLVMMVAVNFLILSLLCTRHTVKPVLAALAVATALATHFMQTYGAYLDPSMLRNVMRTDVAEARELLSWDLLPQLLPHAGLPLLLLWRVQVAPRTWARAVGWRLGCVAAALVALVAALMLIFQPFASLMRNHKELRYLATPANLLWSTAAVGVAQARGAAQPRQPIGLDARPGPAMAARPRPLLLVMVVGETARAANWGLNGYARQTTPQLAALDTLGAMGAMGTTPAGSLLNFADATACGTNTETSVPCLFAPVGRRDYDETRIRGSQSLLHVLARAGVAVHWRDNQSGCKGVCDGLPQDEVNSLHLPGLCNDGRCLDEGLLHGLDERLAAVAAAQGVGQSAGKSASKPAPTQMLVLHMLGNHGPSYFRRYPPAFARFQPACVSDDLQHCSQQEIVNAYDNALLYTDHVLASLVAKLQAAAGEVDSVVLYVSDHGESLGEHRLYLHGLPWAIAPETQKRVPMTMWFSPGAPRALGLDLPCVARRAAAPVAHDHVFHTVLGLLDVNTALHEAPLDLTQGCRSAPAP